MGGKNESHGYNQNYSYQKKPFRNYNNGTNGFNQARPNTGYLKTNYVNVPSDYFKKGENFRRENDGYGQPQIASNQMGRNYGEQSSNYNGYGSSYGKPNFSRGGYQK